MIFSCNKYAITTLKSKFIRDFYLEKKGLEETTKRFNKISGRKMLLPNDVQESIYEMIISGTPMFVGRFGSIELLTTAKTKLKIDYKIENSLSVLCNNAGFFPKDLNLLESYADMMLKSMEVNDIQGVWYLPFEDFAIKYWLNPNSLLTEVRYLEPWFADKPWTAALQGKKVLVIHPFVDTIRMQYENNREKLFSNPIFLPKFDLKTVKAVQTIAGNEDERFDTWFDALDYMYEEAMKEDFDIALIGCGAYGYPLAAKLKNAGKQAIHMGGVLQAMFGIKGKRWEIDKNPIVRNLYNEYWVRPDESEAPKDNSKVEGGCYW